MPNHKLSRLIFVFVLMLISNAVQASQVEMADIMRQDGKIYVVVAVAAIVLAGILTYLIWIDKKLSALEKKMNQSK
jgi:hypothetical protein